MSHNHSRRRVSTLFFVTLFVIGVAACGRSTNSPTGPTSSASQPGSTPASTLSGATISGTVLGTTSSALIRTTLTHVGGMTVTVTSSGTSTTVDGAGHFTLNNVPAGHVDLHFTGNGVDAHLALDGVTDHTTLVITVRVSGTDAHLEDEHHDDDQGEVELSGTIAAASLTGTCAAHILSFMIGTTKIATNGSTRFKDGSCDSLKAGTRVQIEGARQSDNSILAAEVEVEDNEDDNDHESDDEHRGKGLR